MMLTKDGITIDVSHLSDIARYKKIGYVEEKDNPNVQSVKEAPPVAPDEPKAPESQQEKNQKTVEETLQPAAKKSKGGKS